MAKGYGVCFSSLQRLNVTLESYLGSKERVCPVDRSLLRVAEAELSAESTDIVPLPPAWGLVLTVTPESQT